MMRIVPADITYLTEPIEGACVDCGFDALRRVRAYHLSALGVTQVAHRTYCSRCRAEERREREP